MNLLENVDPYTIIRVARSDSRPFFGGNFVCCFSGRRDRHSKNMAFHGATTGHANQDCHPSLHLNFQMKYLKCYVCGFYARDMIDFAHVAYGLSFSQLKSYFEWIRETSIISDLFFKNEDPGNETPVNFLAAAAYASVFSFWFTGLPECGKDQSGVQLVDSASNQFFRKFSISDQVMTLSGGYYIKDTDECARKVKYRLKSKPAQAKGYLFDEEDAFKLKTGDIVFP